MPPFLPRVLLAGILLTLASCTQTPPPAPGSSQYSGLDEKAYRSGYHQGLLDGSAGAEENHEQHYRDYQPETAAVYATGYATGYAAGKDRARPDDSSLAASWELGLEAGRNDAENGLPPDPQRHRANYTLQTGPDFTRGYREGFTKAREALPADP